MRRSIVLGVALSAAAAAPAAFAEPTPYSFDTVHTNVLFFADHLGFSHPMGRFTGVSGGFSFDPDDWSSAKADVTIEVKSLYLGDKDWEKKILSDEFFDAAKFPTMHFVSERLEKTGEHSGQLHGSLTLRGVTRPVVLDVHMNRIGTHSFSLKHEAGFSASGKLKRSEFGMKRLLPAVGDEVELRLEIEGQRAK